MPCIAYSLRNISRIPWSSYNVQHIRPISTTSVSYSRLIRKRITRIPSDYRVYQEDVDDNKMGPNDNPSLTLVNRNPRNLEQLSRELKPFGWELESQNRIYWNKVTFEKVGKYLEAKITHYSGRTIVSASTKEEAYQAQGLSLTDTEAARNLGQILAKRCLEAGILFVHKDVPEEKSSEKVRSFVASLKEHGLELREPEAIFPRRRRDL